MSSEEYMRQALALARQAADEGEVPVGCVVVDREGRVIGRGRNRRESRKRATAHAEVEAIEEACGHVGSWRLEGCSLYVTLEPCPMCAGAILAARIERLYYGAKDAVTGSCGSVINLFLEPYGHEPRIYGGILEEQCGALLTAFFQRLRTEEKKDDKKQSER